MKIHLGAALLALVLPAPAAHAQGVDVYQPGYTAPGGVIVAPHWRIGPEQYGWNAYDNPLTAPHRTEPWRRDKDGDGIPNLFDYDDNDNKLQPPDASQSLLPPRD